MPETQRIGNQRRKNVLSNRKLRFLIESCHNTLKRVVVLLEDKQEDFHDTKSHLHNTSIDLEAVKLKKLLKPEHNQNHLIEYDEAEEIEETMLQKIKKLINCDEAYEKKWQRVLAKFLNIMFAVTGLLLLMAVILVVVCT